MRFKPAKHSLETRLRVIYLFLNEQENGMQTIAGQVGLKSTAVSKIIDEYYIEKSANKLEANYKTVK